MSTRIQHAIARPRVAAPLAFATAAVVAAVVAVVIISPFGGERAQEPIVGTVPTPGLPAEAFGTLPAPRGGQGGGGEPLPPGLSGNLSYTLAPDLSLPASAIVYRLKLPQVTEDSVGEIARRLEIEGVVEFLPEEGGKGGIPASYQAAAAGRSFQMSVDGYFSFQDDSLSGSAKHATPGASGPSEEEARAAAEEWLRLTGLTGSDSLTFKVSDLRDGSRDVTVEPADLPSQLFPAVQVILLVTDGGVAQGSGYWASADARSTYPLRSLEQLLADLTALQGYFSTLRTVPLDKASAKDPKPALANEFLDASVTVDSVELTYSHRITEEGQAYLLPVYVVKGRLNQPGLAEPDPFATWVPATDVAPPPSPEPEVPAALAETITVLRDSLPQHPAATIWFAYLTTESIGVGATYWVRDGQEAVLEFYRRELPAQGWREEEAATLIDTSAFPARAAADYLFSSFTKGDLRVGVVVSANEKDPARGATVLALLVERLPSIGEVTADLNIRSEPTAESEIVGTLKKGEHVQFALEVEGQEAEPGSGNTTWYRIPYKGYVYSAYVERQRDAR